MNFNDVLNEGLVFLKYSKRIDKYIKSIQRKTKNLANEEIKKFSDELIGISKQFADLEKEYKETKDKDEVKSRYYDLKAKNDKLVKELDKRTLTKAIIAIGIVGGVIGLLKLISFGITKYEKAKDEKLLDTIEKLEQNKLPESKEVMTKGKRLPNMSKIEKEIKSKDFDIAKYQVPMKELPEKANITYFAYGEAKRQGVDPNLVLAMIQQESNFKPGEISKNYSAEGKLLSVDKGVMQHNSSNYKYFKKLNGGKDYDPLDYKDNIRLGIKFLKHLLDYYKGDVDKAVMAYNAGQTRVNAQKPPKSTIEYLKIVKRNMEKYDLSS